MRTAAKRQQVCLQTLGQKTTMMVLDITSLPRGEEHETVPVIFFPCFFPTAVSQDLKKYQG